MAAETVTAETVKFASFGNREPIRVTFRLCSYDELPRRSDPKLDELDVDLGRTAAIVAKHLDLAALTLEIACGVFQRCQLAHSGCALTLRLANLADDGIGCCLSLVTKLLSGSLTGTKFVSCTLELGGQRLGLSLLFKCCSVDGIGALGDQLLSAELIEQLVRALGVEEDF